MVVLFDTGEPNERICRLSTGRLASPAAMKPWHDMPYHITMILALNIQHHVHTVPPPRPFMATKVEKL